MCKIPSISSHIPRPSAGCNFSPKQFRLNVLPEAGNSARGQKLRLMPFWANSPRRIFLRWNRSKNSGAGSFARFTLNYAWITSSFAWFFFLMGKCKMMQNAVLFSCRLKVSPELGISPAGCCFSLQIAKRHFLGLGCPFAMYQMFSVTHNILSLGLHECIGDPVGIAICRKIVAGLEKIVKCPNESIWEEVREHIIRSERRGRPKGIGSWLYNSSMISKFNQRFSPRHWAVLPQQGVAKELTHSRKTRLLPK